MKHIKLFEAFGSHISRYNREVRDRVLEIVCNNMGITDPSTRKIIKDSIEDIFLYNPEADDAVRRFEMNKKSVNKCADHIYKWFIRGIDIEN